MGKTWKDEEAAALQNIIKERRIGKFKIAKELIDEQPGTVAKALEGCIIVRAELFYVENNMEYFAYHPDFDPVHPAEVTPQYQLMMSRAASVDRDLNETDVTLSCEWQKIGN